MADDPFPDNPGEGLVIRLLHADIKEMLTIRLAHEGEDGSELPDWAKVDEGSRNGGMTIGADDDRHVRLTLQARFFKERVATKVVVEGLYEVDLRSSVLTDGERVYDRIPNEYRREVIQLALDELFPYLREGVQRASSIVFPISPILLQPPAGATLIPSLD